MRRNPGHVGPNAHAQALRRYLVGDPFLVSPTQWGVVDAVHGSFSSTLYAQANVGTQSIELNAAPVVNDFLLVGTLEQPIQVTAVSGTAAPYTATLALELPSTQASGAAVVAAKTLDLYLDGSQTLSDPTYLTPGVRYLTSYTPAVNDVVVVLRGQSGLQTDRVVFGRLA